MARRVVKKKKKKKKNELPNIETFDLKPGRILLRKYEVISKLGTGWEGEVYKVSELSTKIERAAKFFFPRRNVRDQKAIFYARKLHKLRDCSILIQYLTQERFVHNRIPVTFLVSDYVEGVILKDFLRQQSGGRLPAFQGLHLLYALAVGMAPIHQAREYHGDLHWENVIVRRHGIGFSVKLLDMFHWGAASRENIHGDTCDLVQLFYDAIGGRQHYAKQPDFVKDICCGLKRTLILKKYRSAVHLRDYLETMHWHE